MAMGIPNPVDPMAAHQQAGSKMDQERRHLQALLTAARAAAHDPGMTSLRQLLQYRLEEAKSTLLRCQPDDLAVTQAKAQVIQSILREIWEQTQI